MSDLSVGIVSNITMPVLYPLNFISIPGIEYIKKVFKNISSPRVQSKHSFNTFLNKAFPPFYKLSNTYSFPCKKFTSDTYSAFPTYFFYAATKPKTKNGNLDFSPTFSHLA